jgi:hypothetical protein
MRPALHHRVAKLEAAAEVAGGLTDQDRAHLEAWQARVAERWHGGPPLTDEQRALLTKPGFWQRLQRAWARPAFARACFEAIERRQRSPQHALDEQHQPYAKGGGGVEQSDDP